MIDILTMPVLARHVTAIEENLIARFYYLGQAAGVKLRVEPEVTWFTSDVAFPHYIFNMVVQANFSSLDSTYRHLERILGEMARRKSPLLWCVGPSTRPAHLDYHLAANGLELEMAGYGMTLDLAQLNEALPAPAGVTIERVRTLAQLEDFVHILAQNSAMPEHVERAWLEKEISLGFDGYMPRQRYLGLLDGEPAATSTLFSGAGVAGLYHVATLPQARGRGLGTAISLAAMQDARWLGHRTATLISTPMGRNIYRQLGFRLVNEFQLYLWPGPQA